MAVQTGNRAPTTGRRARQRGSSLEIFGTIPRIFALPGNADVFRSLHGYRHQTHLKAPPRVEYGALADRGVPLHPGIEICAYSISGIPSKQSRRNLVWIPVVRE